jgi:hypothetical protein
MVSFIVSPRSLLKVGPWYQVNRSFIGFQGGLEMVANGNTSSLAGK